MTYLVLILEAILVSLGLIIIIHEYWGRTELQRQADEAELDRLYHRRYSKGKGRNRLSS